MTTASPLTRGHTVAQHPALDADWQQVLDNASARTLRVVSEVVQTQRAALATEFYAVMLAHPEAARFLSHEAVQLRLHPSIQRWMCTLFNEHPDAPDTMAAMQRQVGEVHARAEIPMGLVAKGMRLLKSRLFDLLVQSSLSRDELVQAVDHVGSLMDLAFAEMSSAYVRSREQGARTDEMFRMVTAGQNAALERHRQLAALTDWENLVLRALATGVDLQAVPTLRASAFGLWVQHKAPLMFDEANELERIDIHIVRMDSTLLPVIAREQANPGVDARTGQSRALRDFLADLEEMRFLVNVLFDRLTDLEAGRDVLTQLYNRRFLPTIMRRELLLARRQANSFALVMIDVDHFKRVNDEHGHEAGDRVLQHTATLLLSNGRASDFYFRYGGEEFLAVINEVSEAQALSVAEKIRSRIEQTEVALSDRVRLRLTVSLGVAMYNGHPDYRHLINRADEALYTAKRAGRNRVCLAD